VRQWELHEKNEKNLYYKIDFLIKSLSLTSKPLSLTHCKKIESVNFNWQPIQILPFLLFLIKSCNLCGKKSKKLALNINYLIKLTKHKMQRTTKDNANTF